MVLNGIEIRIIIILIEDKDLEYDMFIFLDDLKQTIDIKTGKPGIIDKIGITTAGDLYQVGDSVVFNNTGTQGNRASAKVSWIEGKALSNISVATSSITGVEVYPGTQKGEYILWSTKPHQYNKNDLVTISGLSTTSSKIGGTYKVGITSDTFALTRCWIYSYWYWVRWSNWNSYLFRCKWYF